MATTSKKLKVTVVSGKNLPAKNSGNRSDPFCEVIILDAKGNKLGKSQTTKVIKNSLNPSWNQTLEFLIPSVLSDTFGMKILCSDKHKFRMDKFIGQVTIKFNESLLLSTGKLEGWFPLTDKNKSKVSGAEIQLQILYGEGKESSSLSSSNTPVEKKDNQKIDTTDLRVSTNFNTEETNNKLKTSTHVIVEEDDEPSVPESTDSFERIREGPATAALEKAGKDDRDISLAKGNLEVTNNATNYTYTLCFAKGNVKVNGGKWYYEVRLLTSGQMQIGWCSANYDPKSNSGGEAWVYDGSRQQKLKNNASVGTYGEYWNNGDIIGCAIDVDAKTVQFWRNGKDLGVAFYDLNLNHGRITPFVGVARRAKCLFNFGKEAFAFPNSYNLLHSFLTEKEIEQLGKLFNKYRDVGNQALIEEKTSDGKTEEKDVETKDGIHGAGLLEFQKDLGITDDEDPSLLIVAWKLKTETVWEISREEFMNGFTMFGCATIDKIKQKLREWRDELKSKEQDWKHFYFFVFDYLKEDKKILLLEEAIMAWSIVFKDRKWPIWDDFTTFLREEDKKSISRDAWQQLWHFMKQYPKDLKEYDPNSSWPLIFDEFVEWTEKKAKK